MPRSNSAPIRRPLPLLCLAALAWMVASGCSATSSQDTGSVQVFGAIQQAAVADPVSRVSLSISAADMAERVFTLDPTGNSWGSLIHLLPAGTQRTFVASAYSANGTLLFQGSASGVTLTAGSTTLVSITLQQVNPPPVFDNSAPVIDALVASPSTVSPGGQVSLSTRAHDADGDALTFSWSAPTGTFSAASSASTPWTAPSTPGAHPITLTVTDARGATATARVVLTVRAETGSAAVNVSFNTWPQVARITASANPVDVGQSTTLSASASDADGDTLAYTWSATCAGSFSAATSSTSGFTPSALPSGPTCPNCTLTVQVTDGRGGSTTGSYALCVGAETTPHLAPVITDATQSVASVDPGGTALLRVTARDPQGSALSFSWSANTGALGTATSTATTSQVAWTAPACSDPSAPPTVTATVTNTLGLSDSFSFSVSVRQACAVTGWTPVGALGTARSLPLTALLASGKVLVASGDPFDASAELYDPATRSSSPTGSLASPHSSATAIPLASGQVLVAGGLISNSSGTSSAELYDPATQSWSSAGFMATARFGHTTTRLPSGKVLVTGGFTSGFYASAELYDPATNAWSPAAAMSTARYLHAATLLPSGKVLVTGGYGGSPWFNDTAELYDPTTDSWSPAGTMASIHYAHSATLLPSGQVLVVGGQSNYYSSRLAIAELYNPSTNTWSSAGLLAEERVGHTATVLRSGKVLVPGGIDNGNRVLSSAQVYDPATNAWSTTTPLPEGRHSHGDVLLPSGQVLLVGGTGQNGGALASVVLYTP